MSTLIRARSRKIVYPGENVGVETHTDVRTWQNGPTRNRKGVECDARLTKLHWAQWHEKRGEPAFLTRAESRMKYLRKRQELYKLGKKHGVHLK